MNPQQTACTFLLAGAFCVVGLLLIPVVHVPVMHGPLVIVIHGPTTALRSFRFAAFIRWLLRAALLIVAGVLPLLHLRRLCRQVVDSAAVRFIASLATLSPLRC